MENVALVHGGQFLGQVTRKPARKGGANLKKVKPPAKKGGANLKKVKPPAKKSTVKKTNTKKPLVMATASGEKIGIEQLSPNMDGNLIPMVLLAGGLFFILSKKK